MTRKEITGKKERNNRKKRKIKRERKRRKCGMIKSVASGDKKTKKKSRENDKERKE